MRYIYLYVFFQFILIVNSNAQEIQWQKVFGGDTSDYGWAVIQTADGGFLVGGSSMSGISGDKTLSGFGENDYWIIKTDDHGNIQWQNSFGGMYDDGLYTLLQTSDHGYLLAGTSDSPISGNKTQDNHGDDYWIVKTDSLGNKQWDKTIGGSSNDLLFSVSQTFDNGYILGGYSKSDSSYDKTENSIGSSDDYWIVKTDSLGNIQWQNTIGSVFNDRLFSMQQTADTGYIIGGYSSSGISGDKTDAGVANIDYWIVKVDQIGNIQWQNAIGGGLDDMFNSLMQTSDGGYILGGQSNSYASGDKTGNSRGQMDYWIVKTDVSGVVQWERTIGGISYDDLIVVQQASDNGYLIGGYSSSNISGEKTENVVSPSDIWIVKTDSSGVIQWQNNIGGNRSDFLYSMCFTNDGIVLVGTSNSAISGDKTDACRGALDYWMVKLTNQPNLAQGRAYLDLNSNSVFDPGEHTLDNKMIREVNTNRIAFTQSSGLYYLATTDSGNYIIEPSNHSYCNVVPAQHNIYFSTLNQMDTANDFAFQPTGNINDLHVDLTPAFPFRPGFGGYYSVHYRNVGTTYLTGNITLYPDSQLSFNSATVTPTIVTADSVSWQLSTLSPGDEGTITVDFNLSSTTILGTLLVSSVKIEPIINDAYPSDNISDYTTIVVGAFDPNDISVNRSTIPVSELLLEPYLDFIIRFQNTGTDTAFNVNINNPLSGMLDLSSFEFIESSHPMSIEYKNQDKAMWFHFENILLPDSNVDEHASHGFLRYRIKPWTTLHVGDIIQNTAYIYFDYNLPVATNTTQTQIVLNTNVPLLNDGSGFNIYPNPADDFASITLNGLDQTITIYDMFGKMVFQKNSTSKKVDIPTKEFPAGVYFIKIQGKNVACTNRILVVH